MTRRTAVYLRASLDTTGERQAVKRHQKACLKIVADRGWSIVETYEDNSISSKKGVRRPAYEQMMRDYSAGRFDAIVCWDLDRLTRVPRELEDMIDAAETGALALVTANGEADLTTDGGRMFARVKVAIGKGEMERKSARQSLAQQQRAEQGRPAKGIRPTGYALDGSLIPEEEKVIRRVFDEFLAGGTLLGIAAGLAADGIATRRGGKWSSSSVSSILRNARYAGRSTIRVQVRDKEGRPKVTQDGKKVFEVKDVGPGNWEPIVTEAEFSAVAARLADPRRKTRGDSTARKHLGSGLFFCTCGLRVRSASGLGPGLTRYTCRLAHHYRTAAPIDTYVLAIVRETLARPDLADVLARPEDAGALAALAAERNELRHRLAAFEADYDAGLIDGRRLKAATEKTEARLNEIRSEEARLTSEVAGGILTAADPVAAFDAADLAMQQRTIDALLKITLHPAPRGSKVFRPESVEVEWRQTQPVSA